MSKQMRDRYQKFISIATICVILGWAKAVSASVAIVLFPN
jgi:hypothetical protein